ncbi:MAG: J domain-containing protein, partial [Caldilineaceae bacterium]|nr:J domain-containing protein [Caldilineaceae bacterium]
FGGNSGFSSFFESLFGGDLGGMGGGMGGSRPYGNAGGYDRYSRSRPAPQPPRQDVPVKVTLEEAFHGTTRTLESSDGSRIQASIPRGVRTGSKIRMKGATEQGDVYLKIDVMSHDKFRREEDDLRVTVPVDLYTALLGGEVEVPTLERSVVLKIPAGTQNGRSFRLRGLGMPNLKKPDDRGDLFAEVEVRLPTDLSEDERDLLQRAREVHKR